MTKKKEKNKFNTPLTKEGFIKTITPALHLTQKLLSNAVKTTIVASLALSLYNGMYVKPSDQAKHPSTEDLIVGENVLDLIGGETTVQQKQAALALLHNKLIDDANFLGGDIKNISKIDAIYNIPYIYEGYEDSIGQLDILLVSEGKKYCLSYDNSYVDFSIKSGCDIDILTSFVASLQLCGAKTFHEMSPIQDEISQKIPEGYFAGNYYIYTLKGGLVNYNIPVYYKEGNEIKGMVYSASKTSLDNYDKDPYTTLDSQLSGNGQNDFIASNLTSNNDFNNVVKTILQVNTDLFLNSIEQ